MTQQSNLYIVKDKKVKKMRRVKGGCQECGKRLWGKQRAIGLCPSCQKRAKAMERGQVWGLFIVILTILLLIAFVLLYMASIDAHIFEDGSFRIVGCFPWGMCQ